MAHNLVSVVAVVVRLDDKEWITLRSYTGQVESIGRVNERMDCYWIRCRGWYDRWTHVGMDGADTRLTTFI